MILPYEFIIKGLPIPQIELPKITQINQLFIKLSYKYVIKKKLYLFKQTKQRTHMPIITRAEPNRTENATPLLSIIDVAKNVKTG